MLFPDSNKESLQNIATKDLATAEIQSSLIGVKEYGQKEVTKFVEERLTVNNGNLFPEVGIHASLRKQNVATFAILYSFKKPGKDKDKNTILKVDRSVLHQMITVYEAGRQVDLRSIMMHELIPVPVSLAEMNGSLRTGNKYILGEVLT